MKKYVGDYLKAERDYLENCATDLQPLKSFEQQKYQKPRFNNLNFFLDFEAVINLI